jgi:hypothetical protein
MFVEGKDEHTIMDWLRCTTPEEAEKLTNGEIEDLYDEAIICCVRDDSDVDYVIQED